LGDTIFRQTHTEANTDSFQRKSSSNRKETVSVESVDWLKRKCAGNHICFHVVSVNVPLNQFIETCKEKGITPQMVVHMYGSMG
jgi:hypothetical protein